MSIARLKSIKQHWLENGLCPRGRPKVLPHNTTKLSDIKNAVRYILQYAEDHAILLPGRIPRYKRDDFQLLPSSITKREVWHLYHSAASTGADTKAVGYSLLRSLEEANSTGDCHPPHDRPLLCLPAEQQLDCAGTKSTCGGEIRGNYENMYVYSFRIISSTFFTYCYRHYARRRNTYFW